VTKKDSFSAVSSDSDDDVKKAVSALNRASWMKTVGDTTPQRQMSENERVSLTTLIAYLAHHSGETEFRVERRLSDRFNVPNMTCLPSEMFEDAVRYLVDAMQTEVK